MNYKSISPAPPHPYPVSHIRRYSNGFALAETIVALLVLSMAIAGLMIMVQYARYVSELNYRERYVTLRVDGELQRLKFNYTRDGSFGSLSPVNFTIPYSARNEDNRITVTITFTRQLFSDMSVSTDVDYYAVTATAEWQEPLNFVSRIASRPTSRFIQLREDYYHTRGDG